MPLSQQARAFLTRFSRGRDGFERAAAEAEEIVRRILEDASVRDVAITSRAKNLESALEKIRRKKYGAPTRQLTDIIGVRVLTFYRDSVDVTADALRSALDIDEGRSPDKRADLRLREFGYRSVHLMARQKSMSADSDLGFGWFEIQIRSLLEHAWAEIEHEVVYKSGVEYPSEFKRQFSAIAGAIEILDREFLRLRAQRLEMIAEFLEAYESGKGWAEVLDVTRLAAVLEYLRPSGRGWRQAESEGYPFPPHIGTKILAALQECEIETGEQLRDAMSTARFRGKLGSYASAHAIPGSEVSHIAIGVIAVWSERPDILRRDFPELDVMLPGNTDTSSSWLSVQMPTGA